MFCSTKQGAGKTTAIAGLAQVLGREKVGYFKPLGEHLVYKKKTLWDLDGALMKELLESDFESQDLTFGFDHSKMRYMYGEDELGERLKERYEKLSASREYFFVEGAGTPEYGHSLGMDAVSQARLYGIPLVALLRGGNTSILDDASFLKDRANDEGVELMGVVVNDIHDHSRFKEEALEELLGMGIDVLGVLPHKQALTNISVSFVVERLFAKVIAGEGGLQNKISQIFVGAMAASHARRHPGWKDQNKLIITAGDRDDLIAAAVEDGAACLVITNDLVPSPTILARADLQGVPILQVPTDTYATAKKLENIDNVMSFEEKDKLEAAREIVAVSGLAERFV